VCVCVCVCVSLDTKDSEEFYSVCWVFAFPHTAMVAVAGKRKTITILDTQCKHVYNVCTPSIESYQTLNTTLTQPNNRF
jgi:hypothetical protein